MTRHATWEWAEPRMSVTMQLTPAYAESTALACRVGYGPPLDQEHPLMIKGDVLSMSVERAWVLQLLHRGINAQQEDM